MAANNNLPTILYCAKGLFHPSPWAQNTLMNLLQRKETYHIVQTRSIAFHTLIEMHHPQLIILYYHEKKISETDLSALIDFVDHGGAIFAIHSASASFKQEPLYHNLLGGRFINHGPIQTYRIEIATNHDEGFFTQHDPYTLKDELYFHEYSDAITIVMSTASGDQIEPVAWIKHFGEGRVAYFAPGHRSAIFHNQQVQTSIYSLINWSLNYE